MRILGAATVAAVLLLTACSASSGGESAHRSTSKTRSPVSIGPFQQTLTAAAANCAVPGDGSADHSCDFSKAAPLICAKFSEQMSLDQPTEESGFVLPVGPLSVTVQCGWAGGLDGVPVTVLYSVRDRDVAADFGAKCETDPAPIVKHCSAGARGTLTYSDSGPDGPNQTVTLSLATPDVTLDVFSSGPFGSVGHDTLLGYLASAATAAELPNPDAWNDPFGAYGSTSTPSASTPPAATGAASPPPGELPTAQCPGAEILQAALNGTDFAAYDMNDIRCDSEGWASASVNNTHEQVAVAFRRDGDTWNYVADKQAACTAGEVPADFHDIICAIGG